MKRYFIFEGTDKEDKNGVTRYAGKTLVNGDFLLCYPKKHATIYEAETEQAARETLYNEIAAEIAKNANAAPAFRAVTWECVEIPAAVVETSRAFEEAAEYINAVNDISNDFIAENYGYLDSSYICDAISDYADGQIDTYNSDLWKWAAENSDDVEEAIQEYGVDTQNGVDLIKIFQQAQYYRFNNDLNSDLDEIIKDLAAKYAQDYLFNLAPGEAAQVQAKTAEEVGEFIDSLPDEIDNNNPLEDIAEAVKSFLTVDEEEESEENG
jgi:hypothetical protein